MAMEQGSRNKFMESVSSMDSDSDVKKPDAAPERANWGGKIEFVLTCIGYAIGLGTVWRFPYLCYKNGGGAFLIPYTIMIALVGLPLFYMELAIGQFASQGPLNVWRLSPLFRGLGFSSVMVSFLIAVYYNVIIAICFYYLFKSMAAQVPWSYCGNVWNTDACRTLSDIQLNNNASVVGNVSLVETNQSLTTYVNFTSNVTETVDYKTPSEEFFYNHVLNLTSGMDVPGAMRWELAGCLLLSWVVVCFVLIKGISSLGKVVYFTALFPYVLLTILLIRGALLDGAYEGVIFYLQPKWSKLLEAQVWSDAAVQVFYAMSVACGGLIAMSSYNKFRNNILRDALIVSGATAATSLWAGFVIFCVLGYMAKMKGVTVEEVAAQGPGLTFVVYPEALSTMPLPPLWSILFFFMMLILGFSSEFSLCECVMTSLLDQYPQWFKTDRRREIIFRISVCVLCFFLGLPMVTQGGFFLLNLIDVYAGGFPLIIVGISELIAINWVYGFRRFNNDIKMMTGKDCPMFFRIMMGFISPALMMGVFAFTIYQHKPLEFRGYYYPSKFLAIGWLTVIAAIGFLPGLGLYYFCKKGGYEVLKKVAQPSQRWGPRNEEDRIGTIYETTMSTQNGGTANGTTHHSLAETGRLLSDTSLPEYEESLKL